MASDTTDVALDALALIGDGWRADEHELTVLDFKETPDTALGPRQRASRNMGQGIGVARSCRMVLGRGHDTASP